MTNSQFTSRRYPWGDEADPNRANYRDTGIGTTGAVGCFPGGASPYGVEDLSGDVWEWTRSLWGKYPYDPSDGREKIDDNDRRVLRGGSFGDDQWFVRCAARYRDFPDLHWDYFGLRVGVVPVSP